MCLIFKLYSFFFFLASRQRLWSLNRGPCLQSKVCTILLSNERRAASVLSSPLTGKGLIRWVAIWNFAFHSSVKFKRHCGIFFSGIARLIITICYKCIFAHCVLHRFHESGKDKDDREKTSERGRRPRYPSNQWIEIEFVLKTRQKRERS